MTNKYLFIISIFLFSSCGAGLNNSNSKNNINSPSIVILGNVQDGGSPHMGCDKLCCKKLFENPDKDRMVVSLGLVDPIENKSWMIEATPDFPRQAKLLKSYCSFNKKETPDGIFITHAHIGHYIGLMYLGKEAMSSNRVPVYAMTRMKGFLMMNGPWSQLMKMNNIQFKNINKDRSVRLSKQFNITPFLVPHRDEFSETVGYRIKGPLKSALFIPDIDKWSKWNKNIIEEIKKVDYAFIDGTFFNEKEINNRDISQIPHPFVIETMELFKDFSKIEKSKIYFIHLNHTNPLLDENSPESNKVKTAGFNVARPYQIFNL